ncbi:MAG: DUF4097 family beta strand repeat protein [Clostridiaceae bacterium]|nr:DUF4097 family beta strand repeat protein [Clostridiaceae bacterium]
MRKAYLFIFFVALVSIAIGGLLFLSTGNFSFITQDKADTKPTNTKTISLDNSNEIYIKASSANINVIAEDRDDVKVNLISSKNSISTYTEDNKLYITVAPISNKNFFFNFGASARLNIILPKNFSNKLSVGSSSGNMSLSNMTLSNLDCSTSSGNQTMKDLLITTLSSSSSSGTISSTSITAVNSSFKSSSGAISLKKFSGNVVTSTSSGNTKIDYKEFSNTLTANSSSGSVRITLPGNSEFNLNATSSSGNVNCSFPIEVNDNRKKNTLQGTVKNDKNKIFIRTASGNISINN